MPLTDVKIKSLIAKDKAYSRADGEGLVIEVLPSGSKAWRYRYRLNGAAGKQEKVTIGTYPEISLSEARLRRSELKRVVKSGISPAKEKQDKKKSSLESSVFSEFALNWIDKIHSQANKTPNRARQVLINDIFPVIGSKNIEDITQKDINKVMDRIMLRDAKAAALLAKTILNQIFDYAISREKTYTNPSKAIKGGHVAKLLPRNRVLSKNEIVALMKALYSSNITHSNKLAIHLLLILMVRKSNVLSARWEHLDIEAEEWRIPKVESSAKNRGFIVYLPKQAVDIFRELKQLSGHSEFVFPSRSDNKSRISDNVLNTALKKIELDVPHFVLHDFRHTSSTILHEAGHNTDTIEKALMHEQSGTRGVYSNFNSIRYSIYVHD